GGWHERIFLAATSGGHAAPRPARGACCQPRFLPDAEGPRLQQSARPVNYGSVTFSDVVVSHEPFSNGILFHELVHVEQYRQLGIPRFSDLYVRGFLNGGSYDAIPLEVNAYTLGGRFEQNPARQFSVADEVTKWQAEGRL